MADATVTLKLTPDELRTLRYALTEARKATEEITKVAAPNDARGLREIVIKMKDLHDKL